MPADPTPSHSSSPAPASQAGSAVTSLSTLDRARAADPTAWQQLVELYSPLILGWCRRSGLHLDDAADVTQDVWVAVSGALGRFQKADAGATFRGWLWTITRNKVRNFIRDRRGATVQPESWVLNELAVPDDEPPDSAADVGGGLAGLMRRALGLIRGDFADPTWQAFWLTTVENVPAGEVAERLGLGRDAVYQAKARVLRRLREEIGDVDHLFART